MEKISYLYDFKIPIANRIAFVIEILEDESLTFPARHHFLLDWLLNSVFRILKKGNATVATQFYSPEEIIHLNLPKKCKYNESAEVIPTESTKSHQQPSQQYILHDANLWNLLTSLIDKLPPNRVSILNYSKPVVPIVSNFLKNCRGLDVLVFEKFIEFLKVFVKSGSISLLKCTHATMLELADSLSVFSGLDYSHCKENFSKIYKNVVSRTLIILTKWADESPLVTGHRRRKTVMDEFSSPVINLIRALDSNNYLDDRVLDIVQKSIDKLLMHSELFFSFEKLKPFYEDILLKLDLLPASLVYQVYALKLKKANFSTWREQVIYLFNTLLISCIKNKLTDQAERAVLILFRTLSIIEIDSIQNDSAWTTLKECIATFTTDLWWSRSNAAPLILSAILDIDVQFLTDNLNHLVANINLNENDPKLVENWSDFFSKLLKIASDVRQLDTFILSFVYNGRFKITKLNEVFRSHLSRFLINKTHPRVLEDLFSQLLGRLSSSDETVCIINTAAILIALMESNPQFSNRVLIPALTICESFLKNNSEDSNFKLSIHTAGRSEFFLLLDKTIQHMIQSLNGPEPKKSICNESTWLRICKVAEQDISLMALIHCTGVEDFSKNLEHFDASAVIDHLPTLINDHFHLVNPQKTFSKSISKNILGSFDFWETFPSFDALFTCFLCCPHDLIFLLARAPSFTTIQFATAVSCLEAISNCEFGTDCFFPPAFSRLSDLLSNSIISKTADSLYVTSFSKSVEKFIHYGVTKEPSILVKCFKIDPELTVSMAVESLKQNSINFTNWYPLLVVLCLSDVGDKNILLQKFEFMQSNDSIQKSLQSINDSNVRAAFYMLNEVLRNLNQIDSKRISKKKSHLNTLKRDTEAYVAYCSFESHGDNMQNIDLLLLMNLFLAEKIEFSRFKCAFQIKSLSAESLRSICAEIKIHLHTKISISKVRRKKFDRLINVVNLIITDFNDKIDDQSREIFLSVLEEILFGAIEYHETTNLHPIPPIVNSILNFVPSLNDRVGLLDLILKFVGASCQEINLKELTEVVILLMKKAWVEMMRRRPVLIALICRLITRLAMEYEARLISSKTLSPRKLDDLKKTGVSVDLNLGTNESNHEQYLQRVAQRLARCINDFARHRRGDQFYYVGPILVAYANAAAKLPTIAQRTLTPALAQLVKMIDIATPQQQEPNNTVSSELSLDSKDVQNHLHTHDFGLEHNSNEQHPGNNSNTSRSQGQHQHYYRTTPLDRMIRCYLVIDDARNALRSLYSIYKSEYQYDGLA